MTRRRLKADDRRTEIMNAALMLAELNGYYNVTRAAVASVAHCDEGLVSHYFGTMKCFKRAIMRTAIKQRRAKIVAQGMAAGDPHALRAPEDLKAEARAAL